MRDHNEHLRNKLVESINKLEAEKQKLSADTSDWLNTQAKEIELNSVLGKLKLEQRKILDYDKKIENLKSKQRTKKHNKWVKVETTEGTSEVAVDNEVDDEDIILEDLVPGINDESDEDEEDEDKYRPVQVLCHTQPVIYAILYIVLFCRSTSVVVPTLSFLSLWEKLSSLPLVGIPEQYLLHQDKIIV